jgi:hypothetical protein
MVNRVSSISQKKDESMKNKYLIALIIFLPNILWADIPGIHEDIIEGFGYDMTDLVELYPIVREWIPTLPAPREEIQDRMQDQYESLQELVAKNPEEIELLLLKALVESWIYNLDVSEYYDLANDSFTLAIELAPQDYRGLWFRGMHKVRATMYIEGYPDLLEVYRQFPHEELDAYFWFDMAYASILGGMMDFGGILLSKMYAFKPEQEPREPYLRNMLNAVTVDPRNENNARILFTGNMAWYPDRELYSYVHRVLNFSIKPDQNSRNLQLTPMMQGGETMVMKNLPPVYQGSIYPSSLIVLQLPDADDSFEQFVQENLGSYEGEVSEADSFLSFEGLISTEAYLITNPEIYSHIGGMKLYTLFCEVKNSPLPEQYREGSSEFVIFQNPTPYVVPFRAHEGSAYYMFMLDVGEYGYDEAFKLFQEWIENKIMVNGL